MVVERRADGTLAGRSGWLRMPSLDGVLTTLLFALVAAAPMSDGSRSVEKQSLNAILVSGLVIAFQTALLVRGRAHPTAVRTFAGPAMLFGLALLWVGLQLTPWMPTMLHHPIWQMAAERLQAGLPGRVTVDPDLTAIGLIRLTTGALVLWMAAQLGSSAVRAYAVLTGIVVIEIGYGIYGLVMLMFAQSNGGPGDPATYLTATFSNRNTYATYAGIGVVICVSMLWRTFRREREGHLGGLRMLAAAVIRLAGGVGALWLGALFVLLACLLLSASRGGVLSTFLGLATLFFLTTRNRSRQHVRARETMAGRLILVGLCCGAIVLALLTFGDLLLGRVSDSGLADAGRLFVYRTTTDAILSSPILGWGYGSFVSVFPMFFDGSGDVFVSWDLAHNTYLEIFLGCGLLAGSLLIAAVVWPAVACARGALARERDASLPAMAAAVSALVGLHALVDFSLQYPGVSLTYALVLGVGFAQARSSRTPHRVIQSSKEEGQRKVVA